MELLKDLGTRTTTSSGKKNTHDEWFKLTEEQVQETIQYLDNL